MKKVNCKKGLSALMAATIGMSMFTATGAGVANAAGWLDGITNIFNSKKNSDEKKPKKPEKVQADLKDMLARQAFKNLKSKEIRDINNSLGEDIENAKKEAAKKINSKDELLGSLNKLSEKLDNVKAQITLAKTTGKINEVKNANLGKISARLAEINHIIDGSKATEFINEATELINRVNTILGQLNGSNATLEITEANDIRRILIDMTSPAIMAQYSFSETKLKEFMNRLSGEFSDRIKNLEDIINGSKYNFVKEYANNLSSRINTVVANDKNRNDRNEINVEVHELLKKIENSRFDSELLNIYMDQLKDLDQCISALEPGFIGRFFNFKK